MDLKQKKILTISGIIISIIGLALCIALIQEFNGNAGSFVSSLCSATGDGDSCGQVAQSVWSRIEVPIIGTIPVALLGFTFYGFCGFLFITTLRVDEEKQKGILATLLAVSFFGLFVDFILFIISITQIGKVCILCVATYFVTLSIFLITFVQVKKMNLTQNLFQFIKEQIPVSMKPNILNYIIAVLFCFSCGIGIGKMTKNNDGDDITTPVDPKKIAEMLEVKINEFNKKPLLSLNVSEAPFIGNKSASVKIVKYADFNCGHCMHASKLLKQVIAENPNDVIVYFKNFPLDGTCNYLVDRKTPTASSCVAATAALCANKQGKFAEMYHGLYEDLELGNHHSVPTVMQLATKFSLNMNQFKGCMGSEETKNFINREVKEAEKLKIESTPSLFINDKALDAGTPNETFLKALVKSIIQNQKK